MRKGPKLRPSLSWEEMAVAIKAIDIVVTNAVKAKEVTKEIMEMAKVKEYLETYKPVVTNNAINEQQLLAQLMAKYQVTPTIITGQATPDTSVTIETSDYTNSDMIEGVTELTDDERYDILKLSGESAYTDDDKMFMLNKGTIIMMQRAGLKKVTANDL